MSTPLKPTRTYAEQFSKIEITAEQRREAHRNALEILRGCKSAAQDLHGMFVTNLAPIVCSSNLMEILHEHPSGTPEWEPVCEPVPLPAYEPTLRPVWEAFSKPVSNTEPIVWRLCERVVMPPAVPESIEDVVQVYLAPRQPK
jgi:hypothetical protein